MAYSNYAIRQKAKDDIERIIDYIYLDNPKAASELYDTFTQKFEYLGNYPETGRLRREFTPNVRSLAVGNYIIFYSKKNPTEIIRVLHGARSFTSDIEQFE